MALIVNGVTIPSSGVVTYNDVSLDKVICNGVTVFEKVIREPASGEYFDVTSAESYSFRYAPRIGGSSIFWGVSLASPSGDVSTWVSGGYTYYRGQYKYTAHNVNLYGIYRIKN